jgi:uncharacterized protein YjbI with pentapeptide repeats
VAGHERCPFHCPPSELPADLDVSAAFLTAIESSRTGSRAERRRGKQFIGAHVATLDLSMAVIDATDNYPVDLRAARLDQVDGTDSDIGQRLDLREATVGDLRLDGSYREIDARGATVETLELSGMSVGRLDLRTATLGEFSADRAAIDEVAFDEATVEAASFAHATVGMADFDDATFGDGNFYHASIEEGDFRGATFDTGRFYGTAFGGGYFNECTFDEALFERVEAERLYVPDIQFTDATFANAEVAMKLIARGSTFVDVDFSGLDTPRFDATGAEFHGPTVSAVSVDDLELDGATLASPRFEGCTLGTVSAADVTCLGVVAIEDSTVEEVTLRPGEVGPEETCLVSLTGTTLEAGTLGQPERGDVVYDLSGASLGPVQFTAGASNPLDRVAFHRTRLTGFDVRDGDDIDLDATGFCLHTLAERLERPLGLVMAYPAALAAAERDAAESDTEAKSEAATDVEVASGTTRTAVRSVRDHDVPERLRAQYERLVAATRGHIDPTDGEVTYLRAKNGANAIADNTAASAFFVSQMTYRRRAHARQARDGTRPARERARGLARWGMNAFLYATTCYGERAAYTLVASLLLILGYAGVFVAVAPDLYPARLQYLELSLGSFIAFLLGGVGPVGDPAVRLLAQSEAFVGGFFIALYVFALTRSVNR